MRRATVALSTFRPLAAVVSWPVRATARKNFKSSQRMARVFCYACVLATMLSLSLHKCKMKMTKWRFRRTEEYTTHRVENRGGVATPEIVRAHVCPVTNAHLACSLMLEKKKLNHKEQKQY